MARGSGWAQVQIWKLWVFTALTKWMVPWQSSCLPMQWYVLQCSAAWKAQLWMLWCLFPRICQTRWILWAQLIILFALILAKTHHSSLGFVIIQTAPGSDYSTIHPAEQTSNHNVRQAEGNMCPQWNCSDVPILHSWWWVETEGCWGFICCGGWAFEDEREKTGLWFQW